MELQRQATWDSWVVSSKIAVGWCLGIENREGWLSE